MRRDLRAALPGWAASRVVVLAALGLAHVVAVAYAASDYHRSIFGWDAEWYRRIAEHGYDGIPREGLRFFPLLPLAARALGALVGVEVALLVLANGSALLLGALLHRLARLDGDAATAGRAAWLVAFTPVSFVLVMPYAEAPATALSVAAFLAYRRGRWWAGAAAGALTAALRPTGVLLALPAAIEAARDPRKQPLARLAAVVAPAAGLASFLVWSRIAYGDAFLPLRVQQASHLRGSTISNPLSSLLGQAEGVAHGEVFPVLLHLPWVVLLPFLLVRLVRRWPASYAAFAGVSYLAGVTAPNFASLERYAFAGFPFVLAAAGWVGSPRSRLVAAGLLGAYSVFAFSAVYVP